MAPTPLTPISEESLPNYSEIKVLREKANTHVGQQSGDRGCLFFYNKPEEKGRLHDDKKQETQAIGLTEHQNKYQIVVDVQGYAGKDIAVKAVGDQELLVEGTTTTSAAAITKSFSRRFCLPGPVQLDSVSSALSSDGVLTVTAPKLQKTAEATASERSFIAAPYNRMEHADALDNDIQKKFVYNKDNLYTDDAAFFSNDLDFENRMKSQHGFDNAIKKTANETQEKSDMVEEVNHYKMFLDTKGYSPKDISVKAVGDRELIVEGRRVEKDEHGTETSQTFNRRFSLPGLVRLEAVTSSISPQGVLTITAPKKEDLKQVSQKQSVDDVQSRLKDGMSIKNNLQKASSPDYSTLSKSDRSSSPDYSTLSKSDRSLNDFFSKDFNMSNNVNYKSPNSFMEKAHNEYNESLKNMMNRNWAMDCEAPTFFSDMPALRNPGQTSKDNSNIIESEHDYKMKLDVRKYKPGDITVKAVGDRELLIEGRRAEKQDGGPAVVQSFSRRFCLPGAVMLEAVTSSLGADGTLTITAPKPAN